MYVNDGLGYSRTDPGAASIGYTYTGEINCSGSDLQPQTFDPNSIQVISEGQTYTGMDDCRNSCQVDVTVCPTSMPTDCKYTFGVTGISNSRLSSCLLRPTFGGINICLDNQTNNWHFNISNLSVPIISTLCTPPSNWTDIGDGTDLSLLQQLITNCTDYNRIMDALNQWTQGKQPCETPCTSNCSSYYSSYAARKHEDVHLAHYKQFLQIMMDNSYKTKVDIPKVGSECANTAFDRGSIDIQRAFDDGYEKAGIAIGNPGIKNYSEQKAWEQTIISYIQVRTQIRLWAIITHSDWFDQFGNCVN